MSLEKIGRSKYHSWLKGLTSEERRRYLGQKTDEAGEYHFCKTCKDAGFIYYPTKDIQDRMFGKVILCPDCKGKGQEVLPPRDRGPWEMTFENWFHQKATEDAFKCSKDWATGSADFIWFLLYGKNGCGKTHLARASRNVLKKRGCEIIYIYALDLFEDLRRAIDNKNLDDRLRLYREVGHLILDDFFLDAKTEWIPAKIEQILNYRYEFYLPVMLTMNIDLKDLPPAILSRFKDAERSRIVYNQAGDYRPKKKEG